MDVLIATRSPEDADFIDLEVPTKWLGEEPLTSVTVFPPVASELTFTGPNIQANTARFFVTGGTEGTHRVRTEITSGVRRRVITLVLTIKA